MAASQADRGIFASYVPRAVLATARKRDLRDAGPRLAAARAALLLIDITGFTRLTTMIAGRESAGVERLSRVLNSYLGQIIDIVDANGGDITKILGDALLPIWVAEGADLRGAVERAASCGLAVATRVEDLELEPSLRLSVKVGVCAGDIVAAHVGGFEERWYFLIAGPATEQLPHLEPLLADKAVVASPEAAEILPPSFSTKRLDRGYVRVLEGPLPGPTLGPIERLSEDQQVLRGYIPAVCLSRLDAGQAEWLAELRPTSVVFGSIRGVSTGREGLLQQVTRTAQEACGRYDGWLKEITVDEKGMTVVAAFGVPPFSHEDDPLRALQAASELQRTLKESGLRSGLSVTTGVAFCGPVGNPTRRDFAVLGPHVNLAARLAQAAPEDGPLCDATTYERARHRLPLERLPGFILKGHSSPVSVYRPAGATAQPASSGLIDRREEIDALVSALEGASHGGSLVVLEGEPGVGKSRLVRELRRLAALREIRTAVGIADAIERSSPYHAWRQILVQLIGLEGLADEMSRRERTLAYLRMDEESLRLAPLFAPILGLDLPDNDFTAQLTGAVRADNTRALLARIVARASADGPLLIVLEDSHWLDSASSALVVETLREVPSLLIVMTTRPLPDSDASGRGWRDEGFTSTIRHIGPLRRDDAIALACERTGAREMDPRIAALMHERTEGNPLFVEELAYALRDMGEIVVDHGMCRPSDTADLRRSIIPDTLQRVLTSRIDQLAPEEALTLKVASVIGPTFSTDALRDVYPLPIEDADLRAHLVSLVRRDLLSESPEASAYEFRHVIAQEVAYNLMLSTQSQGIHRSLAERYEATSEIASLHAFLAHHWQKAGDPAKAVQHLEVAGDQALAGFANDEAVGFFERAITLDAAADLRTDPRRRARWELKLGQAYVNTSRYTDGRRHVESGLALLGRPAPSGKGQQVTWLIGEMVEQVARRCGFGRRGTATTELERETTVSILRAYEALSEASFYDSETLLPLYCVIHMVNVAEGSRIPSEMAFGFAGTGALLGNIPLPRLAEWYLRKALETLTRVEELTTHEIVEIIVGFYYVGAGKWDIARERFVRVIQIARRLGDRRRHDDALANLLEIEYQQGSFATGRDRANDLQASATARGDRRFQAEALAGKAYCSWQLGETAEALACLRALDQLATEGELTVDLRIKVAGIRAVIELGRGDSELAVSAADDAMRLTAGRRPTYSATFPGYFAPVEVYLASSRKDPSDRVSLGKAREALRRLGGYAAVFPLGRPRHLILRGAHEALAGRRRQAAASLRRGLTAAQDLSMPYEEALAHQVLARLAAHNGDRAGHVSRARDIFATLGAKAALANLEAEFVVLA